MKYGLSQQHLNEVYSILSKHSDIQEALLFGSRVCGINKEYSDIDLAVKGVVSDKSIIALRGDFEESNLPYIVDVVNYDSISSAALKANIDSQGVQLDFKG